MECRKVYKDFNMVGMKNSGVFADFGTLVPQSAGRFLERSHEIQNRSDTEIALYEHKRDEDHLEGHYFVGLIVDNHVNEVPSGMDYIKASHNYATTRGKISDVGELHLQLSKWAEQQGFERNMESYIIETYHPSDNDEEDVEIYLPIY